MRGDARLPPSLLRPCDITQRTTKLKLRGSDNCRHYTNHGSHTEPPTTACTASERVEWSRSLHPAARSFFQAKRKGSGKSKEASADGRAGGGMGSRQRQIIEALSIDVSTAISDPPTVNVRGPICLQSMSAVGISIRAQICPLIYSIWEGASHVALRTGGEACLPSIRRPSSIRVVRESGGKLNERR